MATFDVDETFAGATLDGMGAVSGVSGLPGAWRPNEMVRSIHVFGADRGDAELECELRKGSGRGAHVAKLTAKLSETSGGVRAEGTFGPDRGRPSCAVQIVALFSIGVSIYYLVTGDTPWFYVALIVAMVVVLRYSHAIGKLFARDNWTSDDLNGLLTVLHGMYDGANAAAEHTRASETPEGEAPAT